MLYEVITIRRAVRKHQEQQGDNRQAHVERRAPSERPQQPAKARPAKPRVGSPVAPKAPLRGGKAGGRGR